MLLPGKSKMASKIDSYYIWILFQFQGQNNLKKLFVNIFFSILF